MGCEYCYFLKKSKLYPNSRFTMTDEMLEQYTRQYIESQLTPEINFAWQGGEPLLIGLDFYKKALALQEKHCPAEKTIKNSLQTNGTLVTKEWAEFFKKSNFLIGISIDGPKELHNAYRKTKSGNPSHDLVINGYNNLKLAKVDVNVLTTVNSKNEDRPLEVYRYLRDELKTDFIQFIPIVERADKDGNQAGDRVTSRSAHAEKYGDFLIAVFDEWIQRDVGKTFVQIFDTTLASWLGIPQPLCIFKPTCGDALILEHNGDVYACDHYVEPKFLRGNINNAPLKEIATSSEQKSFGQAKRDNLPDYCKKCEVLFACNGECPRNRFIKTPDGDPRLNFLCAGYKKFFKHVDLPMRKMADLLEQGRLAEEIMKDYQKVKS